ncbi:fructoselysine 6-kinase [Enterococcus faecium]|uniref:fructoselysine 6-kinase n=1 Tax=Enterococcus faecium TaxID=1352 RepID=UPI00295EC6A7|nr:fructoselysine 6-kinase [Enterococcus faecium]WOV56328.1 fructoselysine 6-kinase [Enterococcus faecium]
MKLAAIGSNCIDYYSNLDGGTAFAGGGPVNMAVYTKRLGGEASYIGPVGTDEYGQMMIEQLANKGVDTSHIRIEAGETAISYISLDDGERILGMYDEGVMEQNQLSSEDLDFIEKHDLVVCDLWGNLETSLKEIKRRGVPIAFDCADRPDDNASQIALLSSDYVFFSANEQKASELRKSMKQLHSYGPKLVIAMLGDQGSLCFDGREFHEYGIYASNQVVDTLGAGDSYIAGFLTALIDQKSIYDCMSLGAKTASETIGYFGAWKTND